MTSRGEITRQEVRLLLLVVFLLERAYLGSASKPKQS